MLLVITLTWSLSNACPITNHYRAQGYTDAQIEQGAKDRGVPAWIIAWAKRRCKNS